MTVERYEYTKNHIVEANGVGDYQLFCSDESIVPGFFPAMMKASVFGTCMRCREYIQPLHAGYTTPTVQLTGERMPSPDRQALATRRDALFAAYETALQRLGIFTGFVEARSLAQINPEERARMNYAREQLNALRFERVNLQRAEQGEPQMEKPRAFPTAEEDRAMVSGQRKHIFYKTGDADASDYIKDRNGEVVLQQCRVCEQAEAGLAKECPGPKSSPTTASSNEPSYGDGEYVTIAAEDSVGDGA